MNIFSTNSLSEKGTRISSEYLDPKIKAITSVENITIISIGEIEFLTNFNLIYRIKK